jgi:single-strand DNA-binding protein
MASYNKVIMMGNLTRDPQLTYLPSQTPVVDFGLATNRKWRDKDGQDREDVCFIDCRAYGRSAENINKYCGKGRPLMIEGRLTLDQWEGQDGTKRSKHRIFVESFTFVDSRPSGSGAPATNDAPYNQAADSGPAPANTGDDIPF